MIELRAVCKTYGDAASRVEALKGIDLQVETGQFVSIMGPSGSGKTTLLHLMSALDLPSSGSIRIDSQEIAQLDDDALTLFRRRKIGLVFQFFNLLPTLNALDNVLLPIMLDRRATGTDRARAEVLLDRVGLRKRHDHFMHQLSGGEMQRVAIARALIAEPRLLLADEPTGNLDSATGAGILELLRETCRENGMTIIMVTHDPTAALAGNRTVWLKDGRIVRDERTESKPASAAE